MMENYQIALLELIKCSLFKVPPQLPDDTDWNSVLSEAKAQTVVSLAEPAVPNAHKSGWVEPAAECTAHFIRALFEQSNLIKLLNDNNIPLVIIKGCAAAMYYPNPARRTMGDIDFLVPVKDFEAARELLEHSGYEFICDYEDGRDYTYQKGGIIFELHRRYSDFKVDIEDILISGFSSLETHELNGHKFPTFSADINGLILLDHVRHHIYGGLGIRQIIDWMMFLNSHAENGDRADKLLTLVKSANLEKFCKILTKMCVLYLGLPDKFAWCRDADDEAATELLYAVLKSGNFGRKDPYEYRPMDSLTQSVRQEGLFKFLQQAGLQNFSACQKYKFLRPFAWICQIFRFIKRGVSALLHGENLKKDINSGNEKYDFYEKLGIN